MITSFGHLDRDVLIAAEGGHDGQSVGEVNLVTRGGWEHALEQGDARVKYRGAFTTRLGVDVDATGGDGVGRVEGHVEDVERRRRVEIGRLEVGAELKGLDLLSEVSTDGRTYTHTWTRTAPRGVDSVNEGS